MSVAGAKNNGLLCWSARRKQVGEEVLRHGGDPIGHKQLVFKVRGRIKFPCLGGSQFMSRGRVNELLASQVLAGQAALPLVDLLIVVEKIELANFARSQVAVFDSLAH